MLALDIAYMNAKFDHSGFSCSEDMVGAHQNLNGLRDLTTPFSGIVCHPWASTCYDQLAIKFDVSISIDYEDTKCDTKQRKCGSLQ